MRGVQRLARWAPAPAWVCSPGTRRPCRRRSSCGGAGQGAAAANWLQPLLPRPSFSTLLPTLQCAAAVSGGGGAAAGLQPRAEHRGAATGWHTVHRCPVEAGASAMAQLVSCRLSWFHAFDVCALGACPLLMTRQPQPPLLQGIQCSASLLSTAGTQPGGVRG